MLEKQLHIQHLFLRAGFGQPYRVVKRAMEMPIEKVVENIFMASSKSNPIKIVPVIKGNSPHSKKKKTTAEKKSLRQLYKKYNRDLNLAWFSELAHSNAFLREKMALFWHDHFASLHKDPYYTQTQINLIRKHALGNFGTLLKGVVKNPVMLNYLNANLNVKGKPNENFGREVLELFTLGVGNYTEQDIKEASRAFTGWSYVKGGKFRIKKKSHDDGKKLFLGRAGKWTGDDILEIILETKQTAYFLCGKIYKYFVNEKVDEDIVEDLAEDFYKSKYDIGKLMWKIFSSDWFYHERNRNNKIKSPIEYLAGLGQMLEIKFLQKKYTLFVQSALGQRLLHPPNVSGWPSGEAWIDSALLLLRIRLPEILLSKKDMQFNIKDHGDVDDFLPTKVSHASQKAKIDWRSLEKEFKDETGQIDTKRLCIFLLQSDKFSELLYLNVKGKLDIKSGLINALQIPEYQLS